MSTGCIVVFGREPVPGRVKTRLAKGVGARQAAAVYAATLDHTLAAATTSGLRVILSLADDSASDWIDSLPVSTELQSGSDLGARMGDAFSRRFDEGEDRVVVIGSDCPWLGAPHLHQAIDELERGEVVLGPADDGGYWLVAQRPPGVELFTDIPWSCPETLSQTRQRLEQLGVTWIELEELTDIDTIADLDRVLTDPRTPTDLRDKLLAVRS